MTEEFTIPQWMEPYIDVLGGRSEVERLMNDKRADTFTNAPLALVQMGMEERIALLHRLHERGQLRPMSSERGWLDPHPADPTPQQTYATLMGVSAESYGHWRRWNDPYDISFFVDNAPVPDDWKVTGEIEAPDIENKTITFEITHEKIVRAAKEIASKPWRTKFVRECRQLLANPEDCDFDASSGDSLLQYVIFGDIVYT